MCKCNTVTRDDIPFAIWSGLHPDTPHQCVRAQCGFRFFRFLAHSLTNVRSLGCGERCHLSHVIGDSAVVLSGMSRQIALQTLSEALRRTKRVLNARQGMEGAKTLTEGFRRSGAPIPLTRGFQVARNRVSPLQSPFARHWQLFSWLVVVDRRCYSDGGLGFSPDGFRLRSRRCRNRGSSDVLEIIGQRLRMTSMTSFCGVCPILHRIELTCGKRAMQDRQSWSKR